MATQTMLTLDQFLALPERADDGSHYELSEGELAAPPHDRVTGKGKRVKLCPG
jgi:hypothetical protein